MVAANRYVEAALIVPVFKSGNKSDVRNYQPTCISLLCVISKVLEK